MRNIAELLDNFIPGARIIFTMHSEEYAPLLRIGDALELTIDHFDDYSEEGVKLINIRDAFCLARMKCKDGLISVTDILNGSTKTYTERQAEDFPVAMLASVKQITFR